VAAKLGRNYIGVELNEKYIKDFAVPQTKEAMTGVPAKEQRRGQRCLYEDSSPVDLQSKSGTGDFAEVHK
jgi:hypothetical protein